MSHIYMVHLLSIGYNFMSDVLNFAYILFVMHTKLTFLLIVCYV